MSVSIIPKIANINQVNIDLQLQVITSKKYVASIYYNTVLGKYKIMAQAIYYNSTDCTGNAYLFDTAFQRNVYRDYSGSIFYVNSIPITGLSGETSYKNSNNNCQPGSHFSPNFYYSPVTKDANGDITGFPSDGLFNGSITVDIAK